MKFRLLALILTIKMLVSCANYVNHSSKQIEHFDPFERFNRSIYTFNYDILDPYILRPVALAWCNYIPQPLRVGLNNFTNNLEEPAMMVNSLLQGDPYQGMVHFTRFFLNTILGMGGSIDVSSIANLKLQREKPRRFGSTLGHYKVGYGPYIHLPFYGSFTLRDEGGDMIDMLYPALSWLTWPISIGKWIVEGIETRARLLDSDNLLRQSFDPYVIVREAYFQTHDFIVSRGELKIKNSSNVKVIEKELPEIDLE